VIIAGLALMLGPPHLDPPPKSSVLLANPRRDWYFVWIFALLALMPPVLENYFFTAAPVIVGHNPAGASALLLQGERSAARRPWAAAIVIIVVVSIGSFWLLGVKSPWSPDFEAKQLPQSAVGVFSGPIVSGAKLFYDRGCEYCHYVDGHGGHRGPDLSDVGDRLTEADLIIRINIGATNMPAFASSLSSHEVSDLTAFLLSRRTSHPLPS
jgi:ubiquinol-cytochrome c reductase cytochrome b subunit